jgi:hypothetical protein
MCAPMADTATDVRVVATATGVARRRGERGCGPRLDAGRRPRRQIDVSAQFIELMEKLGIASDVERVGPARRARKTSKAVG